MVYIVFYNIKDNFFIKYMIWLPNNKKNISGVATFFIIQEVHKKVFSLESGYPGVTRGVAQCLICKIEGAGTQMLLGNYWGPHSSTTIVL